MEQVKQILDGSYLWRLLSVLCLWCGRQWQNSRVVQWFLHPAGWVAGASEGSVFFRLWSWVRGGLCWLYKALHLDRLFSGSVFLQTWFWCALPVVLAPVLCKFSPSVLVLGLALIGYASLLLVLVRDKNHALAWAPTNRYIVLYAAVYLAGTLFSVNLKTSLLPGVLSVAFILFALVLYNAITTRRQLDTLLALVVTVGALVSFYGILQYLFGWGYQSAAWVDSDMFSSIRFRVPATMGNPNMMGQYLLLVIPIAGAKLLSAKDWLRRLYYLACCGVMCVCMILTFSRGAWLGLLFAGAVFAVLWHPQLILLAPFALVGLSSAVKTTAAA